MRTSRIAAAAVAGLLLAPLLVLVSAQSAGAKAPACGRHVRSATLSHTSASSVIHYYQKAPTGKVLKTTKLGLGAQFYRFTKGGKFVFGRNTYTVGKGATVRLMCAAPTAGYRTFNFPRVALFAGTLTLHTTKSYPGEVLVPEALLTPNPKGPNKLVMTVSRKPTSTSTQGMIYWLNEFTNQPRGVTKVSSKPGLDVTPYVGKRVGDCRYSTTRAVLDSRGAKGYGHTSKGGDAGGKSSYWKGRHRVS